MTKKLRDNEWLVPHVFDLYRAIESYLRHQLQFFKSHSPTSCTSTAHCQLLHHVCHFQDV